MDDIPEIIKQCNNQKTIDLINNMQELIFYQMQEIRNQRTEIIAIKHKQSWTHYDKPIDQYDPSTRKYVDKPPKSGNISC